MDNSKTTARRQKHQQEIGKKANELLKESKKLAGDYYEEGLEVAARAQEAIKHRGEDVLDKVKEKPLASLLIAGGIGFLLSVILRK